MAVEMALLDDAGFQTKTDLQRLLAAAGAAPRKRHGQCFLIDRNLMHKLVESAEIRSNDWAVEVGCGGGSLTSILAPLCARVIAVEIDPALFAIATEHVRSHDNVTLIHGDALKNKSTLAAPLVEAMAQARRKSNGRGVLVANLPYDIATSLVANLIIGDYGLARMCFTVQTEVADRFLAPPETTDYGPISIIAQTFATGSRIARVPPQTFWPSPKVHSSMVRLNLRTDDEVVIRDRCAYSDFLRAAFRTRRKTLGHIFRRMPHGDRLLAELADLGLSEMARPAGVAVEAWQSLFLATSEGAEQARVGKRPPNR